MKRDWKFEPSDFDPGIGPADDGKELCTYQWAARIANAKLDEWRKQATVVYGAPIKKERGWYYLPRDFGDEDGFYTKDTVQTDTHRALLIDIEPIEKGPCEHEPVNAEAYSVWVTVPVSKQKMKCKHCGVPLKAVWSEA